MSDWRPIDTAPKDGTKFWGWLYDGGIVLMHYATPTPDDFWEAGFVKSTDPDDGEWEPKFWKPIDDIGVPPGVAWIEGLKRWRDAA